MGDGITVIFNFPSIKKKKKLPFSEDHICCFTNIYFSSFLLTSKNLKDVINFERFFSLSKLAMHNFVWKKPNTR